MDTDLLVSLAVSILLSTIKNPAKAAKVKAALLKVRNAINAQFPND